MKRRCDTVAVLARIAARNVDDILNRGAFDHLAHGMVLGAWSALVQVAPVQDRRKLDDVWGRWVQFNRAAMP